MKSAISADECTKPDIPELYFLYLTSLSFRAMGFWSWALFGNITKVLRV